MKVYIGLLGDPAKFELYDPEFYQLLKEDPDEQLFYLIGASERDVGKKEYTKMYEEIIQNYPSDKFSPVNGLNDGAKHDISARVGLFPSSTSHLIKGPSFSFAPLPINTTSRYLRIKSKFLKRTLSPFLPFKVVTLAYHPMGGKAAERTNADVEVNVDLVAHRFMTARKDRYFDWFYFEGGSGESFQGGNMISSVLQKMGEVDGKSTGIIPRTIYGGGIRDKVHVDQIFEPEEKYHALPNCIVIGNISEENVSQTIKLIERVKEYTS